MNLDSLTFPIVQISLDVTSIDEGLETAAIAVDAGVDWLEAGTPLILAEGVRAVAQLRARFPDHPIVADLKVMDGGYLGTKPLVVLGAPLVIAPDDFKAAEGASLRDILAEICGEIRSAQGLGRTRP